MAARQQAATFERVAQGLQLGRAHRRVEPFGEPAHQLFFMRTIDLDGPALVRREDGVRHHGALGKPGTAAVPGAMASCAAPGPRRP